MKTGCQLKLEMRGKNCGILLPGWDYSSKVLTVLIEDLWTESARIVLLMFVQQILTMFMYIYEKFWFIIIIFNVCKHLSFLHKHAALVKHNKSQSILTLTCTDCKSRELLSLTSSNGHRLDSMRRWARISFRSLLGGLPEAGGDGVPDGMGLMASTFVMTTCRMFSMASTLEMASRLPSPSHLPRDSCSCTSIVRCGACNTCAVLQWATQQQTQETIFVNNSCYKCWPILWGHSQRTPRGSICIGLQWPTVQQ